VAFVGREDELSRLVGALSADARLVLVVGDAGVGKTRFAGEGMARAAAAGMVMVRGECLPLAGTLPLLPVAQALRDLAETEGGRLLEEALTNSPAYVREEVGRLLPQVGSGGGPGAGAQDGGWRQERLFSAVADLLGAVAGDSGTGLVVEDVHWADSATLDFLTFLAGAGHRDGVTVVATCRSDESPLAASVADWLTYVQGLLRACLARASGEAIGYHRRLGPLSRYVTHGGQTFSRAVALGGFGEQPAGSPRSSPARWRRRARSEVLAGAIGVMGGDLGRVVGDERGGGGGGEGGADRPGFTRGQRR